MGQLSKVQCPNCGYQSEELYGVGGDWGMRHDLVVTVLCPKDRELHDTEAGDAMPVLREEAYEIDPSRLPVGECPVDGQLHPPWDAERRECPRCGEPGCDVVMVGVWD